MKSCIAIILVSIAIIDTSALASDHHGQSHKAKAPCAGDTVFPGSPEWLHAGSPRRSVTGEEVTLIWGTDGKLHPLGYAIEDADGSWVPNTPKNQEMIEDHKETIRLKAAVRLIMRDMPDRKILRPAKICTVSITLRDTGYNPYKVIMEWADSIARVFDDQYFFQEMHNYYQSLRSGLGPTPFDEPLRD